ncbi:hypothetical protein BUE80_DR010096 [Diplocarpon rosae]|nr:hypothetical protein BUE80_DR010096 [Diplocarpon rosae]
MEARLSGTRRRRWRYGDAVHDAKFSRVQHESAEILVDAHNSPEEMGRWEDGKMGRWGGLAYVGLSGLDNATTTTVVTFSYDDTDTTVPWTIASNTSSVSFNETLTLYIIPTSGTFAQIGFAATDALPEGAVNTGFAYYGSDVAYAADTSNYQLSFWVKPTSTRGVFGLYWKADGATQPDGAFAVTVKNKPPVFPDFPSED